MLRRNQTPQSHGAGATFRRSLLWTLLNKLARSLDWKAKRGIIPRILNWGIRSSYPSQLRRLYVLLDFAQFFSSLRSHLKSANYTVSQKVPTFKVSVTSSNFNLFSKCLHCWKTYEICYRTYMTSPTSSLNTMSIVDTHCSDVCCDEFLVP